MAASAPDDSLKAGVLRPLLPLLSDADPEVRAQASKVWGDQRFESAQVGLSTSDPVAQIENQELRNLEEFLATQKRPDLTSDS